MGRRQKYDVSVVSEKILDTPEHVLHLSGSRRYDPDGGASAGEGAKMSMLVDECTGDWSWKPQRDRALGYDTLSKKCKFVTFLGVPKSAAEMFQGRHA